MDHPLTCRIIRTKRRKKTLSLYVEHDGSVVIRAPSHLPTAAVEKFVNEKKPWIDKKLRQITSERMGHPPRKFVSGEEFLYLGGQYKLQVSVTTDHQRPLSFTESTFYLDERYQEKAKDLFVTWYKEQAVKTIRDRLQFYSQTMQLSPRRERITSAKHQWGGCSSRNTLSFSWRLMMAPLSVIDYIVVHELGHIKEKNHSPRFWKIVETTLPDYRIRRDWLKRYGYLLNV
ncbi:MAG: SprT family zinc-dependent metalloprotease [Deltaproteobacteria bacterium]